MARTARRFTVTPRSPSVCVPVALIRSPLSSTAKTVYLVLASYADFGTGEHARPAQDTLAAAAGASVRTVRRALDELRAAGWVTATERRGAPTEYSVHHLPEGQAQLDLGTPQPRTKTTGVTPATPDKNDLPTNKEVVHHGGVLDPTLPSTPPRTGSNTRAGVKKATWLTTLGEDWQDLLRNGSAAPSVPWGKLAKAFAPLHPLRASNPAQWRDVRRAWRYYLYATKVEDRVRFLNPFAFVETWPQWLPENNVSEWTGTGARDEDPVPHGPYDLPAGA